MSVGSLGFDQRDYFTDPLPLYARVQVLPARKWAEDHPFGLAE